MTFRCVTSLFGDANKTFYHKDRTIPVDSFTATIILQHTCFILIKDESQDAKLDFLYIQNFVNIFLFSDSIFVVSFVASISWVSYEGMQGKTLFLQKQIKYENNDIIGTYKSQLYHFCSEIQISPLFIISEFFGSHFWLSKNVIMIIHI